MSNNFHRILVLPSSVNNARQFTLSDKLRPDGHNGCLSCVGPVSTDQDSLSALGLTAEAAAAVNNIMSIAPVTGVVVEKFRVTVVLEDSLDDDQADYAWLQAQDRVIDALKTHFFSADSHVAVVDRV